MTTTGWWYLPPLAHPLQWGCLRERTNVKGKHWVVFCSLKLTDKGGYENQCEVQEGFVFSWFVAGLLVKFRLCNYIGHLHSSQNVEISKSFCHELLNAARFNSTKSCSFDNLLLMWFLMAAACLFTWLPTVEGRQNPHKSAVSVCLSNYHTGYRHV